MIKPELEDTLIKEELDTVQKSALKTLLYFDIFNHPLTIHEAHHFLHEGESTNEKISKALNELVEDGVVKERDNYVLVNDSLDIIERRKNGEAKSAKAIKTAKKYSKIIASFPFVRAVFLSGSLSKGYMDEKSDIDYFIVTAPGRLWLARTLLILFKKIFLFNSRKNFCLNYFVANDNLEIPDRNIFTATELVSVIPTYNYEQYKQFLSSNTWSREFLPNSSPKHSEHCIEPSRRLLKSFFEKMLSGRLGEILDTYCFRITLKHWKRKFAHFDESNFDQRLRSRKNVSKHHPLGYQFKVLQAFEEKIKLFELKHGIKLS